MNFDKIENIISPDIEKVKEYREQIEKIKSLKTGFQQIAELILVLLGEKPATDLTVFTDTQEEVSEEEEKLKNIGLKFKKKSQNKKNGRFVAEFSIASEDNNLDELLKAAPSVDHEKFGLLMGFPPSAVKAFLDKKLMSSDEERKLFKENSDIVFSNFRLSQKDGQVEIETLRRWSNRIKEVAPDIYKKLKGE
jgi:hypothetical protein